MTTKTHLNQRSRSTLLIINGFESASSIVAFSEEFKEKTAITVIPFDTFFFEKNREVAIENALVEQAQKGNPIDLVVDGLIDENKPVFFRQTFDTTTKRNVTYFSEREGNGYQPLLDTETGAQVLGIEKAVEGFLQGTVTLKPGTTIDPTTARATNLRSTQQGKQK